MSTQLKVIYSFSFLWTTASLCYVLSPRISRFMFHCAYVTLRFSPMRKFQIQFCVWFTVLPSRNAINSVSLFLNALNLCYFTKKLANVAYRLPIVRVAYLNISIFSSKLVRNIMFCESNRHASTSICEGCITHDLNFTINMYFRGNCLDYVLAEILIYRQKWRIGNLSVHV